LFSAAKDTSYMQSNSQPSQFEIIKAEIAGGLCMPPTGGTSNQYVTQHASHTLAHAADHWVEMFCSDVQRIVLAAG
jgi:hypothetical protein